MPLAELDSCEFLIAKRRVAGILVPFSWQFQPSGGIDKGDGGDGVMEAERCVKSSDAIAVVVAGKAGVVFKPTGDFPGKIGDGALLRRRRGVERRADRHRG